MNALARIFGRILGMKNQADIFQASSGRALVVFLDRVMAEGDIVAVKRSRGRFTVYSDLGKDGKP